MSETRSSVDGIVPHTAVGQHILTDPSTVDIAIAQFPAGAKCVEIGPGTGVLTQALMDKGLHVTAYEIDRRCETALSELTGSGSLKVRWQNFLDADDNELSRVGAGNVIGNVPFHISEPLVRKLAGMTGLRQAVLLLGENFVHTLTVPNSASPDWSRMSMWGRGFFDLEILANVPRDRFIPPPRVDAVLLSMVPKDAAQTWRTDAVARSYRAMIEADGSQSTIATALKTVRIKPNGNAESSVGGVNREQGRRSERRMVNQELRELRDGYNAGDSPEKRKNSVQGDEMFALVRKALGDRREHLFSKPLRGLATSEAKMVCNAIESIVNFRKKR